MRKIIFKADRCIQSLRGEGLSEEFIQRSRWIPKCQNKEVTLSPATKKFEIDGYLILPQWCEFGGENE
jgi:hypothetical protein